MFTNKWNISKCYHFIQVIKFSKAIVKIIHLLVSDELQLHVRRKYALRLKAAALLRDTIPHFQKYSSPIRVFNRIDVKL